MPIVMHSKLSVQELKKHLADHVAISAEALENTELCGKMPAGLGKFDLVNLCDKKAVLTMAKYVTDAGVMDIYARIPEEIDPGDNEEEEEHVQIENARLDYHMHADLSDQPTEANAEQCEHQTEANGEQQYQQARAQQAWKLPVSRAKMQHKGKGPVVDQEQEAPHIDSSSDDSDYDGAHEADDSNSSADDEEAILYRKIAKELKMKVKK
jgi:hypothetical protein